MVMTIIGRGNEVVKNLSVTEEQKEIIKKFLDLPSETGPYGMTIRELLVDENLIINFGEMANLEAF